MNEKQAVAEFVEASKERIAELEDNLAEALGVIELGQQAVEAHIKERDELLLKLDTSQRERERLHGIISEWVGKHGEAVNREIALESRLSASEKDAEVGRHMLEVAKANGFDSLTAAITAATDRESRLSKCIDALGKESVARDDERKARIAAVSRLGSVTNLLDAARGCTDLDAHLTLRAIREVVVETRCEHEWIDIRNKVIESGEMCSKCHALRAGNSAAIVGSRPDMSASGQAPNADSSTGEDRPAAPMFDMNTPLDAPVRIREREERERSQRTTARFIAWMDSDEGRRLVQEAYASAKASAVERHG